MNPTRKTKYDLIAAMKGDILINIDSQIPNKVVNEALLNKKIDTLHKYSKINRERRLMEKVDLILSYPLRMRKKFII